MLVTPAAAPARRASSGARSRADRRQARARARRRRARSASCARSVRAPLHGRASRRRSRYGRPWRSAPPASRAASVSRPRRRRALYTERVAAPADGSTIAIVCSGFWHHSGSPIVRTRAPATLDRRRRSDAGTRARRCSRRTPRPGRPFAAICPGSAWRTKRWPLRRRSRRSSARSTPTGIAACFSAGRTSGRSRPTSHAARGRSRRRPRRRDRSAAARRRHAAGVAVAVTNDSAPDARRDRGRRAAGRDLLRHRAGAGLRSARRARASSSSATSPAGPCGRHGGERCPRGTDDCMELVTVDEVRAAVARVRALAA